MPIEMILGKVRPKSRIGTEVTHCFGLKRAHFHHRPGLGAIPPGQGLGKWDADVPDGTGIETGIPKRVGDKLDQGGFPVGAGHGNHLPLPQQAGQIQLPDDLARVKAPHFHPRVIPAETGTDDNQFMPGRILLGKVREIRMEFIVDYRGASQTPDQPIRRLAANSRSQNGDGRTEPEPYSIHCLPTLHRSLRVPRPTRAKASESIQNRMTTFDSCHPFNSKW